MDDFEREVYCICGLPFDALDMASTIRCLHEAKFKKTACFLTTPNLNFLAQAQNDADFRNSVIASDVVIADGAPIVWVAKLLGIPIRERVAGSSLFEALSHEWRRKRSVYFFGGPVGVAAEASMHINAESAGLTCVGYLSPGFGTVDEMSQPKIIDSINISAADFLVVALGAKKGQAWIVRNLHNLNTPLISHLGAVINFEAKRLKRAPASLQKLGLEWLWRIKEEPQLWRRYWNDGRFLLRLLSSKILPLAIWLRLNRRRLACLSQTSKVTSNYTGAVTKIVVSGVVLDPVAADIRRQMQQASMQNKGVHIDLANTHYLGFGFLGLLLMLKKQLDKQGLPLKLIALQPAMKKLLDRNGLTYLMKGH
jgi:N-acetylglucosaminyldiphosphoundecaprenol N-acetyl-beta-D-mannosaminyltransferase